MSERTIPWDIFISHASEDKDTFVAPLAERLSELAVRVWYDRLTLNPGDSLTQKIGEGLARSRCGLVVISKAFLRKPWPQFELSGLLNRFVEDKMRLVPIWLDVSRADVAALNPALADLVAIVSHRRDVDAAAISVLKVVRPQLYRNLSDLGSIGAQEVTIKRVEISRMHEGPVRHHDLPAALLVRIQNVYFATRDVLAVPLAQVIENFQRDLDPAGELEIWEQIVGATHKAMDALGDTTPQTKREVFQAILAFSNGLQEEVIANVEAGRLGTKTVAAAAEAFRAVVPSVTVWDVDK